MSVITTDSASTSRAWRSTCEPIPSLQELLSLPAEQLSQVGLACVSLVCATDLPGAEDIDIPSYLARVKEWAAYVRGRLPRFANGFRMNPGDYANSEALFRLQVLVQVLKDEIGIHYNPERIPDSSADASPPRPFDSRDLLINGPLGPTRAGTCSNIPMIVVAVGRELGYPVYLAAHPSHMFVRLVDYDGRTFNAEPSCPGGMHIRSDEHFRAWPVPMSESVLRTGYYLRAFTSVDELALCMVSRAWVLEANHRFSEAAFAYSSACALVPTEPMYPRRAAICVGRWMRASCDSSVPGMNRTRQTMRQPLQDIYLDPRRLLPRELVPLALSLLGRYHHVAGHSREASAIYAELARPGGPEWRDARSMRQLLGAIPRTVKEPQNW